MLRPATPLSVLFFGAFVLLLLSTISTPIIKAIPLASLNGVDYGVFGACKGTTCTGIKIGYNVDDILGTSSSSSDFTLSGSARQSLSAILIVHPVAALLSLICFGLSVAAHFHGPAHSPRYLLALLILSFPTLLVSLLAFLVDILIFVPHMRWGGWIVLAATVLIVASGIVTCAMRRTLVSRKARKKRIAENAEMNGANFFSNRMEERQRAAVETAPIADQFARAESPPPMPNDPKYAQYSSFEKNPEFGKDISDTEPLNDQRSLRSNSASGRRPPPDAYGQPPMPYDNRRRPSRDQYGNPLPPDAVAAAEGLPPPGLRSQGSRGSLNSQGSNRSYGSNRSRGTPPGYGPRGRGGMGPPRGGGYGPRGGYGAPRGNYGPMRGGYGPMRGGPNGMRGPSPNRFNGPGGGNGMTNTMMAGPIMAGAIGGGVAGGMARAPSPGLQTDDILDYYDGQPMPPPRVGSASGSRRGSPAPPGFDGPVGQAVEMDERSGSDPTLSRGPYNLRDSDSDVAGMLALQQGRANPARMTMATDIRSPTSMYSDPLSSGQSYVAPRSNWAAPSPLANGQNAIDRQPPALRMISASPTSHHSRQHSRQQSGSEVYYEDVAPRFADNGSTSPVPHALMPGAQMPNQRYPTPTQGLPPLHAPNATPTGMATIGQGQINTSTSDPSLDYPATPDGARSPTGSETSQFTSVSQRGINPQWRPPPGPNLVLPPSSRYPRREDVLLGGNPDFSLPGMSGRGSRGGPMSRGNRTPDGGMPPSGQSRVGGGMVPDGRYPAAI